jgi:hypothetical protein
MWGGQVLTPSGAPSVLGGCGAARAGGGIDVQRGRPVLGADAHRHLAHAGALDLGGAGADVDRALQVGAGTGHGGSSWNKGG